MVLKCVSSYMSTLCTTIYSEHWWQSRARDLPQTGIQFTDRLQLKVRVRLNLFNQELSHWTACCFSLPLPLPPPPPPCSYGGTVPHCLTQLSVLSQKGLETKAGLLPSPRQPTRTTATFPSPVQPSVSPTMVCLPFQYLYTII